MTPRQQRRLEQKLARKAAKRLPAAPKEISAFKAESTEILETEPAIAQPIPSDQKPEPRAISEAKLNATSLAGASTPDSSEEFAGRARAVAGPVSAAKLAANVVNAQLSTGAVTEAGKAIASQNATKHGLTGKFKVLACESQSDFDELLAGFLRSESPDGEDEIEMVHQMAEALWLSRRCVRLQNDCFAALESAMPEEQRAAQKSLALYMRYQTTQDRTFVRYSTELRKRRTERARYERGFVSQKHKEAAECRRQQLHQARQALQNVKQEAQQIRNRLAAAKAEALELGNLSKKPYLPAETKNSAFAAAA